MAAYALLSWPPHAMAYVVAPVIVARRGRRHGWRDGRPGPLNRFGLLPIAGGATLIGWSITSHYRASPDGLMSLRAAARRMTPEYLVTDGAYGLTRNPLYVGGALMWTGWAMLFGNARIVGAGSALFSGLATVGTPFEERVLEKTFGAVYADYRARVPRWL